MTLSEKPPLQLAVIGSGLGSAPHFRSLEDLADQVAVRWVHGRDAQRLAAEQLPASWRKTSRLQDILEDPNVHAALVLTPPNTHLDIVRQLARAGKHVLVEKPLDISLARATDMVDVCESSGVFLGVMLQHRLRGAALALARLITGGELRRLLSANVSVRWWRPQSYYDEAGRGSLARDGGGVLMTQAIHTLDLFLSLAGLPQRVTGMVRTSLHRMEGEDTAAALLEYDNGAVASLQATTAAFAGFPERIEMNFSQGSATLASGRLDVQFVNGSHFSYGASESSGAGADPMAFDHAAHRAVLEDFVAAVQTGRQPAVSGRSALMVQRVIEAIVASSATGAAVTV